MPSSKMLVSSFGFRNEIPLQLMQDNDLFRCFFDSNNFSLKFESCLFVNFFSLHESCVHKPFPILVISSPMLMSFPHF